MDNLEIVLEHSIKTEGIPSTPLVPKCNTILCHQHRENKKGPSELSVSSLPFAPLSGTHCSLAFSLLQPYHWPEMAPGELPTICTLATQRSNPAPSSSTIRRQDRKLAQSLQKLPRRLHTNLFLKLQLLMSYDHRCSRVNF